ncbi:MAG: type II toxin-antitoxin system RelE/ParE family toxin [Campylobacterota bacterium]|nr:type II toxin-antitoxin system RelE/ParE family toxin [Campylobacterota bacterium]
MKIIESDLYKQRLRFITLYIKKDNQSAAVKFAKDLKKQIKNIPNMPYKYRKSKYHDDESVRDMTYKGYTIIYKIYDEHIKIVEIFNQNLPILKETNL